MSELVTTIAKIEIAPKQKYLVLEVSAVFRMELVRVSERYVCPSRDGDGGRGTLHVLGPCTALECSDFLANILCVRAREKGVR